jgi:enolase
MKRTAINELRGRRVWDSRGRPTVEAEVVLGSGAWGRAIAPAGASTGAGEAKELRDGDAPFGGLGVRRAVANVNGPIRAALLTMDVRAQAAIDAKLIALDGTADKSRLGANALVAVSLACAQAAAAAARVPLWRHLAGERRVALPVPQIQIFGGGAHARGRVDVQDYLVVCPGAGSFAEALEWTAEVYAAAGARLAKKNALQGVADEGGYWPAFRSNEEGLAELVAAIEAAGLKPGGDVAIALDIAATQLWRGGRYQLALENRALSAEQMTAMLLRWIDAYPIVSIEDPFAETDHAAMQAFTRAAGARVQIVGDDYFVTDPARLRAGAERGACNAILLKPNQIGTLSETHAAWQAACEAGYAGIMSARSGETEDLSIVHLAVGWGVPQLKVGSFSRSERMAKWNEGIRIEEALGTKALLYPARKLFRRPRGQTPVARGQTPVDKS